MNINVAMCTFFGSGAILFAIGAPAPWHVTWIPLAALSFLSAARAAEDAEGKNFS